MDSKSFQILDVPEILKPDVECFIVNEFDNVEGALIRVLPNAIPGIVFQHRQGQPAIESIRTPSTTTSFPPTLFLCGAGVESSVMKFGKGKYSVIQVILKPQALKSLFDLNALVLKDGVVELNEFSRDDLNEQLLNAQGIGQQVNLLTQFLLAHKNVSKTRDLVVEESLYLIDCSAGKISVRMLSERLHISERQLERRFCQTVGISPSSYIRVRRFNEVVRLMHFGQYETLTDIAYALHYHDQSHFIRDIKSFTGMTPGNLSQKAVDFFHNQAGYSYI